jgi:type I restriction enzyme S subunit
MGEWKTTALSELADLSGGFAFRSEDYSDSGRFILRTVNILEDGRISRADAVFLPEELCAQYERFELHPGDTLFVMVGATLGKIGYVRERDLPALLNQNMWLIRAKEAVADSRFMHYAFRYAVKESLGWASGSAREFVRRSDYRNLPVLTPPLPEQRAIASVFSSLDDKIDLLHQQNETLEKLAETLFGQWFVEEVHEGWETGRLEDLIAFDPPEKVAKDVEPRYFDMKCLSENSMDIADGTRRHVGSGSSFRNGDTLLAKITPCLENGKTGFVMNLDENEVARGSTEFIVMRPKNGISPYFVYCLARSSDFRNTAILSMTGTSGRQRVQTTMLKAYEMKFSHEQAKQFHSQCRPIFSKIRQNQIHIRPLTQMRDTLLPKLMSGEVKVA